MTLKPKPWRTSALEGREWNIIGSKRGVMRAAAMLSDLEAAADDDVMWNASRHAPLEASADVLVGDQAASLWLGGRLLSTLPLDESKR
jgi:hypothetical protein